MAISLKFGMNYYDVGIDWIRFDIVPLIYTSIYNRSRPPIFSHSLLFNLFWSVPFRIDHLNHSIIYLLLKNSLLVQSFILAKVINTLKSYLLRLILLSIIIFVAYYNTWQGHFVPFPNIYTSFCKFCHLYPIFTHFKRDKTHILADEECRESIPKQRLQWLKLHGEAVSSWRKRNKKLDTVQETLSKGMYKRRARPRVCWLLLCVV